MVKDKTPFESASGRSSLLIAASPIAVKYSAVLEKGPSHLNPSAEAVANLSITGSPVVDTEEMEPIREYARVASSVCTFVHWVMMCSWVAT